MKSPRGISEVDPDKLLHTITIAVNSHRGTSVVSLNRLKNAMPLEVNLGRGISVVGALRSMQSRVHPKWNQIRVLLKRTLSTHKRVQLNESDVRVSLKETHKSFKIFH